MCKWNGNRLVKNPTSRMSFMHPFFGCTLTENQSSISHRLSCSLKCSVLVGGQEYINSPYHYISSMSIRNIWPVFVCKRHEEDTPRQSVNAIIKEDMCFVGDRQTDRHKEWSSSKWRCLLLFIFKLGLVNSIFCFQFTCHSLATN